MARSKGSRSKAKATGATRDLTGRKPGKQTAAEIKQAIEAMSQSDRLAKLKEHGDAIDKLEEDRRGINAQIKKRREQLAAIGFTAKGMDWARRRLAEDPEIRDANIDTARMTFIAYGLNKTGKIDPRQGDIFAGKGEAKAPAPTDADDYAEAAHAAGFRAAAEGRFRTENPHAPDTAEHAAWNDGWDRQTREQAESMAPLQPEAVH